MPAIVVTAVFAIAWSFYSPLKLHYVEAREQHRLEVQLAELKERNQTLRAEVERLKTPEGVEELARTSLGLVKDGENLYVVVDGVEESATPEPVGDDGMSGEETPLWQAALDLVFGVR